MSEHGVVLGGLEESLPGFSSAVGESLELE
jgi:hypothetical protein